jgi:cobalt-zinc-cadmium efflux system outer membrane protein
LSDTGYVVSVGIPIPVFNRGQHEEALARAEYESATLGNQVLRQQIETEVRGAYAAAELSRRSADEYGHTINAAAGDLSRIAQLAYEEGEQGILELLDAYRTELQSQIRWLDLKHRAKEAQIQLELASGKGVTP